MCVSGSGSHHVHDFEFSKREGDGIGRRGDRQHEGQRGSDGAGEHHIQGVDLNSCGLRESSYTHENAVDRSVSLGVFMCLCLRIHTVHVWFTIEARMGRNRVVVAVLLEHSVNVATSRLSSKEMANGGMLFKGANCAPSQSDRPDSCKIFQTHGSRNFYFCKRVRVLLFCTGTGGKLKKMQEKCLQCELIPALLTAVETLCGDVNTL